MKTFKLTVTEEELTAIIQHHVWAMYGENGEITIERSSRIHDLTKRLNKKDNEPEEASEPEKQTQPETQTSPIAGWQ